MKVRILHVLELLTAHPSEQLTTTLLKTLAMIRGSAQIPTQPRSHGLSHAFTQSLIPNESSELACVAWRFWLGALSNKDLVGRAK